jgi:hypothetical protein
MHYNPLKDVGYFFELNYFFYLIPKERRNSIEYYLKNFLKIKKTRFFQKFYSNEELTSSRKIRGNRGKKKNKYDFF